MTGEDADLELLVRTPGREFGAGGLQVREGLEDDAVGADFFGDLRVRLVVGDELRGGGEVDAVNVREGDGWGAGGEDDFFGAGFSGYGDDLAGCGTADYGVVAG